ncbi:MAG: AraC family transcriptional regulator [Candidatus Limivicinus sp.]|jgi:AraC-like DNA-binding protein
MKRKKESVQFRYYNLPEDSFVFAKLGPSWIREYGKGIDYLHFHNVLEIGVCQAGTGEMIFRDEICRYEAGDITVIPRKYPHTTNSTPGTYSHWEYLFINENEFLEKVFAGQSHSVHRRQILDAINKDILFFPSQKYPELSENIFRLMECLRKKEMFYQEEAEGLLSSLLTRIAQIHLRDTEDKEEELKPRTPTVVMEAIDYISKHYGEGLTVESLAGHCSVSDSHLRRLFTAHMKMGILEYINYVRVHEACRLLRETDMGIADISFRCGFASSSTFNRNFKRVTGESPSVWRSRPENYEQSLLNYPIHSEFGW